MTLKGAFLYSAAIHLALLAVRSPVDRIQSQAAFQPLEVTYITAPKNVLASNIGNTLPG